MTPKSLELWRGWSPLREFARMQNELDRLFQADTLPAGKANEFAPTCEITETKTNYVFKFDMPGINKDQVKIELEGNQLTVSAERKEEKKSDDKKTHYSEVHYGQYARAFTFPTPVNDAKVDAKFENGVLVITVPKAETNKSKLVQIQ